MLGVHDTEIPEIFVATDTAPSAYHAYHFAGSVLIRNIEGSIALIGFKTIPGERESRISFSPANHTLRLENIRSLLMKTISYDDRQEQTGLGEVLVSGDYAGPGSVLSLVRP